MENSTLNQAHGENRKADRLLRRGHFDRAVECHEKALGYLTEAMTACDLTSVQESLAWQRNYHLRQVWLLQTKISLLEKYKKKRMEAAASVGFSSASHSGQIDRKNRKEMKALESNILRTLSEADSALHSHITHCNNPDPGLKQIMECHDKLRQLLEELFNVEEESVSSTDLNAHSSIIPALMQDSLSRPPTSVSPDSDRGCNEMTEDSELPALAPLEVPQFDFDVQFG